MLEALHQALARHAAHPGGAAALDAWLEEELRYFGNDTHRTLRAALGLYLGPVGYIGPWPDAVLTHLAHAIARHPVPASETRGQ